MMLIPDKKQIASLILAKRSEKENGDVVVEKTATNATDMNLGYEAAAQKMLEAFESKDVKKLVAALKEFNDCSESKNEDAPEAE